MVRYLYLSLALLLAGPAWAGPLNWIDDCLVGQVLAGAGPNTIPGCVVAGSIGEYANSAAVGVVPSGYAIPWFNTTTGRPEIKNDAQVSLVQMLECDGSVLPGPITGEAVVYDSTNKCYTSQPLPEPTDLSDVAQEDSSAATTHPTGTVACEVGAEGTILTQRPVAGVVLVWIATDCGDGEEENAVWAPLSEQLLATTPTQNNQEEGCISFVNGQTTITCNSVITQFYPGRDVFITRVVYVDTNATDNESAGTCLLEAWRNATAADLDTDGVDGDLMGSVAMAGTAVGAFTIEPWTNTLTDWILQENHSITVELDEQSCTGTTQPFTGRAIIWGVIL